MFLWLQHKTYQADFLCISFRHVELFHNCWKKFLVFQDSILVGIQLIENCFKSLSFVARHFVVPGYFVTCMELEVSQLRVCRCVFFRVETGKERSPSDVGTLKVLLFGDSFIWSTCSLLKVHHAWIILGTTSIFFRLRLIIKRTCSLEINNKSTLNEKLCTVVLSPMTQM